MQIKKNKLIAIALILFMMLTTVLTFNILKGLPDIFETSDIWLDE